MKKTFLIAVLLVFAFSSSSIARSNWGIGMTNAVANIMSIGLGGFSQLSTGTLFYNFNDRHSIEGSVGLIKEAYEDGDSMDMTVFGVRYLYNVIASKNLNVHVGLAGMLSTGADDTGSRQTMNSIGMIFGGETFINDVLSLTLDLTALSSNNESDPSSSDDNQQTAINVWPSISFRYYIP